MRKDETITINGRHLSMEVFVRLCGLVALPIVEGTSQNRWVRNETIHELARYLGLGVATKAVPAPDVEPESGLIPASYWYGPREPISTVVEYAGLFIRTKRDGRCGISDRREGGTNIMPGATSFASKEDAIQAINVYKAVDGDSEKFWHLWAAVRRGNGK